MRPDHAATASRRQLAAAGHDCVVVAPSLIPRKPGDRIKTDRRDAINLVGLHPAGALTAVWIPLWLPPVMQEPSDRLVACDRVRTSIRPRSAAFPEAAGRDGDLRIRSKSCKRACELEAPHWFPLSRSVRSFRPFRSSSSHTPLGTVAG